MRDGARFARIPLSAGRTSTRVAWIAGARPNTTPVSRERAAATPSTFQLSSARGIKFGCPLASSRPRKRMPQIAKSTPRTPPRDASTTLSVSNCRTTRSRLAPTLSRNAISRRRAAARASSRFAIFAHAIARINPTSSIRTYSGLENWRRSASSPPAPSFSRSSGRFDRASSLVAVLSTHR